MYEGAVTQHSGLEWQGGGFAHRFDGKGLAAESERVAYSDHAKAPKR
jgi:hypothetical protein